MIEMKCLSLHSLDFKTLDKAMHELCKIKHVSLRGIRCLLRHQHDLCLEKKLVDRFAEIS